MKEEFLACKEGVGIIDMSSFSKIDIKVGIENTGIFTKEYCINNHLYAHSLVVAK